MGGESSQLQPEQGRIWSRLEKLVNYRRERVVFIFHGLLVGSRSLNVLTKESILIPVEVNEKNER